MGSLFNTLILFVFAVGFASSARGASLFSWAPPTGMSIRGGFERIAFKMPDDTIQAPDIWGYSGAVSVGTCPVAWRSLSPCADVGVFALGLGAKLTQNQAPIGSADAMGRIDASEWGVHGRLGLAWDTPLRKLRVMAGGQVDWGLSGRIKIDIGVIQFDEKLNEFLRYGAYAGVHYAVLPSLRLGLGGGYNDGEMRSKSQNGESLFSLEGDNVVVGVSSPAIWFEMQWVFVGATSALQSADTNEDPGAKRSRKRIRKKKSIR